MNQYIAIYRVVIEAPDDNMAELISIDLEGDIMYINKKVKEVYVDPYLEKVE